MLCGMIVGAIIVFTGAFVGLVIERYVEILEDRRHGKK